MNESRMSLHKADKAISLGVSALIVIIVVLVAGFGLFLNATLDSTSSFTLQSETSVSSIHVSSTTTLSSVVSKSNSSDSVVISDINSSLPCGVIGGIIGTGQPSPLAANLNALISQINSSSQFISLEGNETGQYMYNGGGCASYMGPPSHSTQQPSLSFNYVDKYHPFPDPCGGTAYPVFYINAIIDVVSNGYIPSLTTYQTIWFNEGNTTFTCPITSSLTG